MLGVQTNVLYAHPSVPAKTIKEFVAYAKANPGKLSFGSGGVGTPAHLAGELLKIKAGIDFTHVPFRGTGPTLQSVIGNHVPTAFNPPSPLMPHLQAGTIKAIAITTLEAHGGAAGYADHRRERLSRASTPRPGTPSWRRPNTPKEVIATLNKAVTPTLNDPAMRKALTDLGVDVDEQHAGRVARLHQVRNPEMGRGGEGLRRDRKRVTVPEISRPPRSSRRAQSSQLLNSSRLGEIRLIQVSLPLKPG